ncbi:MAG: FtsX-like permease family protein, partial [Clostridiales bacterium]|nr:FtsX-like permease family protein [Clostridiales bacterium]
MNFKLACRNILNNFREYKIYFFTIILSVSVFYVFNSIESQKLMMNYKFNNNDILSFVEGYLEKASFLVSIIIGFLLIYANNFLIKRRKKEIKIYSIIGMKKYQICSLIFIETFIIGVISLVFGLIIGVLLSQGLSIITAKLFDTNIVKFKFIFSF